MYGLTDADFLLNFSWSGPYKTSVYYFYAGQFNWNSKRSLSCIIGENILTTTSYCTYTVFVNAVCLLLLWSSFSSCCSCFLRDSAHNYFAKWFRNTWPLPTSPSSSPSHFPLLQACIVRLTTTFPDPSTCFPLATTPLSSSSMLFPPTNEWLRLNTTLCCAIDGNKWEDVV